MDQSINKKIRDSVESRERERNKFFEMMLSKQSKEAVNKQFEKYEEAHNKALEAYRDLEPYKALVIKKENKNVA